MSSLDDFKGRFYKFRAKKYALPLALLLTFVVCALLLMFSAELCFGYLAVAVIAYYVPYFFGMKDRKKLAVFGIILLIAIAIPYGVKLASDFQGYADATVSSDNGVLSGGKVAPFNAVDTRTHNFTVTVSDPSISNVSLLINDWWTNRDLNSPDQNLTMDTYVMVDGDRQFYKEVPLPDQTIYAFRFSASNGTAWTDTEETIGPVDMPASTLYTSAITGAVLTTLLTVGVLFYLLLLMTWITERSKKKAAEMQKGLGPQLPGPGEKGKGEKFICSACRAEVPADAKVCPQCGEKFDEDETTPPKGDQGKGDEYYCTDCGATVKESDTKCPNCGKEFEN